MKVDAVEVCSASSEWLSVGPEGFTKPARAVGYPLVSVCGTGTPAALLVLPPELPNGPAPAGGGQAARQLL